MKYVYVVVSQTGSFVSRLISRYTGDRYAHVSISFEDDLSLMYSFGRVYACTPVIGGFVRESASFGTMKRFKNTEIVALRIPVSEEKKAEMKAYVEDMYANRKKYHYSFRGVYRARKGRAYHRKNYYYCSEFVREVLEKFGLADADEFGEVALPEAFLTLRRGEEIYTGKLHDYVRIPAPALASPA